MTCTPRMALILAFGLLLAFPVSGQADDDPARTGAPAPGLGAPLDDPWGSPEIAAPRMDDHERIKRPGASGDGHPDTVGRTGSSAWIRTTLSLAGVVALIILLAWGYRVGVGASSRLTLAAGRRGSGLIQVLGRTRLSPRQSVCLIRVGPQLVLVGATGDSLRTLSIINDPDLAARLAGQEAQRDASSHLAEFRCCLETEAESYDRGDHALGDRTARILDVKERLSHAVQRLRAAAGGG